VPGVHGSITNKVRRIAANAERDLAVLIRV
jgi:hypothetical protein